MTKQEENKALVLAAFDTLFNQRDYVGGSSGTGRPTTSSTVPTSSPGRTGLFDLIRGATWRRCGTSAGVIVAEGD